MKQIMLVLLAMVIGLVVSNVCYAQLAKDPVRTLQRLQARVEAGISYLDYAPAVGDVKLEVNLFLQSPEAKENTELAWSVKLSMSVYELALSTWQISIAQVQTYQARPEMILKSSVESLGSSHPEVADAISAWNGISETARRNNQIPVEYIISGLWREAGKELQKAITLLSEGVYNSQQKAPQLKAVESLPPETAKPEKPIASTSTIPPSSTTTVVTVTWTSADIRSGAGNEFPIVMTVDKGDKLTVIGERGEWFNVRLEDGKEGWINSEAVKSQEYAPEKPITSAPTTFSSGTRKILTWDFSVVKSGPGNDYPVIATFRKGDKLTILGQSGEWVRVRSDNNQEGWISSKVLE